MFLVGVLKHISINIQMWDIETRNAYVLLHVTVFKTHFGVVKNEGSNNQMWCIKTPKVLCNSISCVLKLFLLQCTRDSTVLPLNSLDHCIYMHESSWSACKRTNCSSYSNIYNYMYACMHVCAGMLHIMALALHNLLVDYD